MYMSYAAAAVPTKTLDLAGQGHYVGPAMATGSCPTMGKVRGNYGGPMDRVALHLRCEEAKGMLEDQNPALVKIYGFCGAIFCMTGDGGSNGHDEWAKPKYVGPGGEGPRWSWAHPWDKDDICENVKYALQGHNPPNAGFAHGRVQNRMQNLVGD